LAGARERAGRAAEFALRRTRPLRLRDTVRAGNDQGKRSCRTFFSLQELAVTAYLISLALAGLLAIAIWECLE